MRFVQRLIAAGSCVIAFCAFGATGDADLSFNLTGEKVFKACYLGCSFHPSANMRDATASCS